MSNPCSELARLVAGVTHLPSAEVSPDLRFDATGTWSSLAALRLLTAIEEHFEIRLELRHYLEIETVEDLYEMVMNLLATPT
jgi:acyl carrier protein